MLRNGFQSLFQTMISKEGIRIKYNTEITSINRYLNDEKHKICLMFIETDDNEEREKLLECDALFCATDISKMLPYISDLTQEEDNAFGCISAHTLCTTLFECDIETEEEHQGGHGGHGGGDETDDDESDHEDADDEKSSHSNSNSKRAHKGCTFYPDHLLKKDGHLFKVRNSSKMLNGEGHWQLVHDKGLTKERLVGYQMLGKEQEMVDFPDLEESLQGILLDDLSKIGKKNVKVLRQNVMPFCPQWSQKDIHAAMPWLVKEELQGKYKNMYYIGSSVCFQSIESVLEYNIQLTRNTLYL